MRHRVRDPGNPKNSVEGPGPIQIFKTAALQVTVGFTVADSPSKTEFAATVSIVADGTTAPVLFHIPIEATVDLNGTVTIITAPCPVSDGILAGTTGNLVLLLQSTMPQDTTGSFFLEPGNPALSAPSVQVFVPARSTATVTLPLTCAAGTRPGYIEDVGFSFAAADPAGNASILLRIQVITGRSITFDTNLFPTVSPGSSVPVRVIVSDSGGNTMIAFQEGTVPSGVSLLLGEPRVTAGGVVPGEAQIIEMDMVIAVSIDTPPGNLPIPLNWSVAADDTHSEIDGVLTFDANVLFAGQHNYFLTDGGNTLFGVVVMVRFENSFVSTANGWSIQLNAYSVPGFSTGWQQFIIKSLPDDPTINATIQTWNAADSSAGTIVFVPNQMLALVPTIQAGYSASISLTNDSNGHITGAEFALTNERGQLLGPVAPLTIDIVGQQLVQAPGGTATAANLAPIRAFQLNIVGHGSSTTATIDGGFGTISYSASKVLTVVHMAPGFVADMTVYTAENSNVAYGVMPGTASAPQTFQAIG